MKVLIMCAEHPTGESGIFGERVLENYLSSVTNTFEKFYEKGKVFVFTAPEYALSSVPMKQYEKERMLDKIIEFSESCPEVLLIPGTFLEKTENFFIKNTCYVIKDGEIKAEVCKKRKAGLEAKFTKGVFRFFHGSGGNVLEENGIKVGVEICRDYLEGDLKKKGKSADLHICVACGAIVEHKNIIAESFVINDGYEHYYYSALLTKSYNQFEKVMPVKTFRVGEIKYSVYEVYECTL